MEWIAVLISLIASITGAISGIGGGVIIKPVLDAMGNFTVQEVSFLSGCTVLSMTLVSVSSSQLVRNRERLDAGTGTLLSIGAVAGGLTGKRLFDFIVDLSGNDRLLGSVQTIVLITVTIGSFVYSFFAKRIKTKDISNIFLKLLIGSFLGMISSFLGIGGGPIHLTALAFFFSMSPKKAALHSLYIILLSQTANIVLTFVASRAPRTDLTVLSLMILGGVFGGFIGRAVNKKISQNGVNRIFQVVMVCIIGISVYNLISFLR